MRVHVTKPSVSCAVVAGAYTFTVVHGESGADVVSGVPWRNGAYEAMTDL